MGGAGAMTANLPVPILAGKVLDPPAAALPVPAQADRGRDLIALWVARSASPHIRRNYAQQAARPRICRRPRPPPARAGQAKSHRIFEE
jgi:hypothetical protein